MPPPPPLVAVHPPPLAHLGPWVPPWGPGLFTSSCGPVSLSLLPEPVLPCPVSCYGGGVFRPSPPAVPSVVESSRLPQITPSVKRATPWGMGLSQSVWVKSVVPLTVGLNRSSLGSLPVPICPRPYHGGRSDGTARDLLCPLSSSAGLLSPPSSTACRWHCHLWGRRRQDTCLVGAVSIAMLLTPSLVSAVSAT